MTEHTITDVACTRCACVCDDLSLTVRDNRIVEADGACRLAHDWYLKQNSLAPPAAVHDGVDCLLESAIATAAQWLKGARYPLIYGLSGSSTPGQRAARALADRLGATIDTTASEGHAPSLLALQESGESTCSLGEIRHRADLVIFWGTDPEQTHPRHLERYSLYPESMFLPNGRADRTMVLVDHASSINETAAHADVVLDMPEGGDFAALWTLRLLLKGREPAPGSDTGLPLADLRDLAERMKSCRCGVILFGYGAARQRMGHRVVEAILRLVIDLNAFTRFHARRMRVMGDVAGADNVLCWQTGFPFAVNLSRGYPRFSPSEFSAAETLARGEPDVALIVGSDRVDHFPPAALEHLRRIPSILLESPYGKPPWSPNLRITTATYGVHLPGTAYRMDDVPIPLRASLTTHYPSDANVLTAIDQAIAQINRS